MYWLVYLESSIVTTTTVIRIGVRETIFSYRNAMRQGLIEASRDAMPFVL